MITRILITFFSLGVAGYAQLANLLEPVEVPGFRVNSSAQLDRVVRRLQTDTGRHLLDGETLLRSVEKELTNHYGVNGELKLSFIRPWVPVTMADADFSLTVTEPPADGLASSFVVKVKVVAAAEIVGEWALSVRAQLLQEMWAANGRIERGQPLDRNSVTVQKVDVLRDRQPFLSAETDPQNFETIQTIVTPRLLVRRDVVDRPIVRKGQVVEVVAKQGLLTLSMKALALENGTAGSLVKLRNLESHKEFNGQVIDESKVQIQF
jgi:flagella basal body P-ring formation protein FlgA